MDSVEKLYREDDCRSKSEFIEKAIRFYCGYLAAERAAEFLPAGLASTLEGVLTLFGERLGRLLFKLAVEQAITNHILAADTDIDAETLDRLRGRCVNDVKRTNGQISFREILKFQKEG